MERKPYPSDLTTAQWARVQVFFQWSADGTWERINDALRAQVRAAAARDLEPSVAIMDSQSVKITEKGPRGYDTGKKVCGRKRHIAVDALGLLPAVVVHAASNQWC